MQTGQKITTGTGRQFTELFVSAFMCVYVAALTSPWFSLLSAIDCACAASCLDVFISTVDCECDVYPSSRHDLGTGTSILSDRKSFKPFSSHFQHPGQLLQTGKSNITSSFIELAQSRDQSRCVVAGYFREGGFCSSVNHHRHFSLPPPHRD